MPAGTAVKTPRKTRKQKLVESTPEPAFVPVHAASMSTPIWDQLTRELGEPNLNPYPPDPGPDFGLVGLFELHKPSVSVRELLPAWAADTGQYLVDRAALEAFRARMAGENTGKEDNGGENDSTADSGPVAADGPGEPSHP